MENADESTEMVAEKSPPDPACFGLIGLFNLMLKDSSKAEEFEAFLKDEYNALTKDNFPGMRWLVLKADRGPQLGKYVGLVVFDTANRRDEYWPKLGQRSEAFNKKWDELHVSEFRSKFREFATLSWVSDYQVIQ